MGKLACKSSSGLDCGLHFNTNSDITWIFSELLHQIQNSLAWCSNLAERHFLSKNFKPYWTSCLHPQKSTSALRIQVACVDKFSKVKCFFFCVSKCMASSSYSRTMSYRILFVFFSDSDLAVKQSGNYNNYSLVLWIRWFLVRV